MANSADTGLFSAAATAPPLHLPSKLFEILTDEQHCALWRYVRWTPRGESFEILNVEGFTVYVLPALGGVRHINSFIRHITSYGFNKLLTAPFEFEHPLFQRDHPEWLERIEKGKRQSKSKTTTQQDGRFFLAQQPAIAQNNMNNNAAAYYPGSAMFSAPGLGGAGMGMNVGGMNPTMYGGHGGQYYPQAFPQATWGHAAYLPGTMSFPPAASVTQGLPVGAAMAMAMAMAPHFAQPPPPPPRTHPSSVTAGSFRFPAVPMTSGINMGMWPLHNSAPPPPPPPQS